MNDQLILRQGEHPVTIVSGDNPYVLICYKSHDEKRTYEEIAVPSGFSLPTLEDAVMIYINGRLSKSRCYWVHDDDYDSYSIINGDTGLIMPVEPFQAFNVVFVRRIPIVEA